MGSLSASLMGPLAINLRTRLMREAPSKGACSDSLLFSELNSYQHDQMDVPKLLRLWEVMVMPPRQADPDLPYSSNFAYHELQKSLKLTVVFQIVLHSQQEHSNSQEIRRVKKKWVTKSRWETKIGVQNPIRLFLPDHKKGKKMA